MPGQAAGGTRAHAMLTRISLRGSAQVAQPGRMRLPFAFLALLPACSLYEPDEATPLQRELDRTGRVLGLVVMAIAVVMVVTIVVVEDVRTALDWLDSEFHLPLISAGFSFGAAVGMKAACPDPRVQALIMLGTPIHITAEQAAQAGGPAEARSYRFRHLQDCPKPKLLVSGANDSYSGRLAMEELAASLPEPKHLELIENTGHFFEDHLTEMREAIEQWVRNTL